MKSLNYLFVSIALVCFSCQENNDDDTLLQLSEIEQETANILIDFDEDPPLEEPWLSWSSRDFEIFVTDIARLTAYAIMSDVDAETQFRTIMLNNGGVVSMEQLLGPSASSQDFYDSFEQAYLYGGAGQGCRPDGFEPTTYPNGRSASAFDTYLVNILNDHCIELYMPVSYDPNQEHITAVSHPLTDRPINEGYLFTRNTAPQGCVILSNSQIVNSNFPATYTNLIIARPYPNDNFTPFASSGTYCDYTVYDHLDFTLWFAN